MDNPVKTITDNQNRKIIIGGNGTSIVAEHKGIEIGRFEFDEIDQSCLTLLTNCDIDINYQRGGIGKEMMFLAEEWYNDFCIVDHFSIEGAAFITYCRDNLFNKTHSTIKDNRY